MNCKNCNVEVTQNYCPNCGQTTKIKRIDGHYLAHEIRYILNFERGILFTVKELIIRPGENVRHFILENRSRLVKPIIFIIVTSLIYTLINQLFHIDASYIKFNEVKQSTTGYIFKWITTHYGYANIIMAIFIAFWAKIFFRKFNYNFFEILILLCFVIGIGMLIYSVFSIFKGLTHIDLMPVAGGISLIYTAWSVGQFFDKSKFSSYVKALCSYFLGFLTFSLCILLIGTLIDLIIKH